MGETVEKKVYLEVPNEDGSPYLRCTRVKVGVTDFAVIQGWRYSAEAFHEYCFFWRAPHSPTWNLVEQASIPRELTSPFGWIKEHPELIDMFAD